MARGNADFIVSKGFGIETKGGESPETLPNKDAGRDATEEEEMKELASGKGPKKGGRKTEEDDLTISKDVDKVREGAEKDIADTYVQDCQRKGYERYNDVVAKGIAANIELNPYNVGEFLDNAQAHTQTVCKEIGSEVVLKGRAKEAYEGAKKFGGRVVEGAKEHFKRNADKYKAGGVLAGSAAGGVGLNVGARGAAGAIGAGEGKRGEGAKAGIKESYKADWEDTKHPIRAIKENTLHPIKNSSIARAYRAGKETTEKEEKCIGGKMEKKGIVEAAKGGVKRVGEAIGTGLKDMKNRQALSRSKREKTSLGRASKLANHNQMATGGTALGTGATVAGMAGYGVKRALEKDED